MIWVIAGTAPARRVISELRDKKYSVVATTATEYGSSLIKNEEGVTVLYGERTPGEMKELIRDYAVRLIVDVSHPYAVDVSTGAMGAARELKIPYVRYERERTELTGCTLFDSYEAIARYLSNKKGAVLLAIGSKNLSYFTGSDERKIFARVLPLASSIEHCREAGIPPERIIAMQFPFSAALNRAFFEELHIKYLVTKESGSEGGVDAKIAAAKECAVEVLVLKRPELQYPLVVYSTDDLLERVDSFMKGSR